LKELAAGKPPNLLDCRNPKLAFQLGIGPGKLRVDATDPDRPPWPDPAIATVRTALREEQRVKDVAAVAARSGLNRHDAKDLAVKASLSPEAANRAADLSQNPGTKTWASSRALLRRRADDAISWGIIAEDVCTQYLASEGISYPNPEPLEIIGGSSSSGSVQEPLEPTVSPPAPEGGDSAASASAYNADRSGSSESIARLARAFVPTGVLFQTLFAKIKPVISQTPHTVTEVNKNKNTPAGAPQDDADPASLGQAG
jgi:hypothetical protein